MDASVYLQKNHSAWVEITEKDDVDTHKITLVFFFTESLIEYRYANQTYTRHRSIHEAMP